MDEFMGLNLNDPLVEEDGILQSLSINDHNQIHNHNDLMDIDDSFEFRNENANENDTDGDLVMTPIAARPALQPINSFQPPSNSTPRNYCTPISSSKNSLREQIVQKNLQEYVKSHPKQSAENDDDDNEISDIEEIEVNESPNTSLVSTFSQVLFPTALGARLATNSIVGSPALIARDFPDDVSSEGVNLAYSNDFKNYKGSPNMKSRMKNFDGKNMTSFTKSPRHLIFKTDSNSNLNSEVESSYDYDYDDLNNHDSIYENDIDESGYDSSAYGGEVSYSQYKTPLQTRVNNQWGTTPVQLQMHHHHYYSSPTKPQDTHFLQLDTLPAPWENKSEPKDKTPYILSSYLQLILNCGATCYALYLVYGIIGTINSDIKSKMAQEVNNLIVEIASCKRSYDENGCIPERIVPALEEQCAEWEKCMNRDPYFLANKSSISAETLGMIINSLVEPMGIKSFIIIGAFILILFIFNFSFGFLRAKSYYGWNSHASQTHNSPVHRPYAIAATPQRMQYFQPPSADNNVPMNASNINQPDWSNNY